MNPLRLQFHPADLENLPFRDESFEMVVSSHVLEHLPDFKRGLSEIRRVTRRYAVIALPTCLNPCATVILGGDRFWTVGKRTPYAFWLGACRTAWHLFDKGVNEGYGGRKHLPHLWRYPWVLKKELREAGFEILHYEAPCVPLPYLGAVPGWLRVQEKIDRLGQAPILRYLGYGSLVTVQKR